MSNKEIASAFKLLSNLMEIHGEDTFKSRTYSIAAFQIDQLEKPLSEMDQGEIAQMKGFGKAICAKIEELLTNGNLSILDNYLVKTPPGILDLMKIKGIGSKKISVLWKELGIGSSEDLLEACKNHQISPLKGFGKKTEEKIQKSIEYYHAHQAKFLYAEIEDEAEHLLEILTSSINSENVSFTGELRRRNIVLDQLEFLIGTDDPELSLKLRNSDDLQIDQEENGIFRGFSVTGIPFVIYSCPEKEFPFQLFLTTGSDGHIQQIGHKAQQEYRSEIEIYKASGFPYIAPELRENKFEFELAEKIPSISDQLLSSKDIKGIIHAHSTYSDGKNSLEEMATACMKRGYEYLGISDHSQTAYYAGGLKADKIKKQHEEIDKLNEKLAPFRIFKGIESDILTYGNLDYPDAVLEQFDFIIASIHGNQNIPLEKAMERLITAASNPYTTFIGHCTGRLLNVRPGYPVDHHQLIDVCAKNGVIIELNSNPRRLDIDWEYIPYALSRNMMISINPDSHSIAGIDDVRYGVYAARKGGVTSSQTFNALGVEQVESYFLKKKSMRRE